ncbi:MAG: hypothetical protein QME57_01235 [Patescibacteria group bacterium]|nr:hypothetical protein [Patescibacteria group bacterium]
MLSNLFAGFAERKYFGRHTVKTTDSLPSINLNLKMIVEKFIASKIKKLISGEPIFIDVEINKE